MSQQRKEPVKVIFQGLRASEEADWPPYDSESIWAIPLGAGRFRLDNIPFFAKGVAYGDVVHATTRGVTSKLVVDSVLSRSGHSTYRVTPVSDDKKPRFEDALTHLVKLGCQIERFQNDLIVAVDIPPGVPVQSVYSFLETQEDYGVLDFEEGYYNPGT